MDGAVINRLSPARLHEDYSGADIYSSLAWPSGLAGGGLEPANDALVAANIGLADPTVRNGINIPKVTAKKVLNDDEIQQSS